MITMLEGVPGAGKSYHAVAEFLLPWLRANRRLYLFVEGVYLDRIAALEGSSLETLVRQVTVWKSSADVVQGLLTVEPGSAVIVDEVQSVFRAKAKVDPEILRWLETHRHRGVDLVLMCQNFKQVTSGVTRLVEVTMAFRRLDRFGLKNRYQAKVRGNPEELEVIRQFAGKYEPKVYNFYASYSSATVRESARGGSILKSPTVMLGLVGIVAAGVFFSSGKWLSVGPASVSATEKPVVQKLPPPVMWGERIAAAPVVSPVRISGAIGYYSKIRKRWEYRYLSEDGKILTLEEIVGLSGGMVREVREGETVRLIGDGVVWKPVLPLAPALPGQVAASPSPRSSAVLPPLQPEPPVVPGPFDNQARPF